VADASVDHDAFEVFEASGWEEKAAAYERLFGDIAGRVVEPLLNAAAVGVGMRVLDVATGRGRPRPSTGWSGCSSVRWRRRAPAARGPSTRPGLLPLLRRRQVRRDAPSTGYGEPADVRRRIRAAFDHLAAGYRLGDVLELPVAVKLAAAHKPDPRWTAAASPSPVHVSESSIVPCRRRI
jgi:hypothetical protein